MRRATASTESLPEPSDGRERASRKRGPKKQTPATKFVAMPRGIVLSDLEPGAKRVLAFGRWLAFEKTGSNEAGWTPEMVRRDGQEVKVTARFVANELGMKQARTVSDHVHLLQARRLVGLRGQRGVLPFELTAVRGPFVKVPFDLIINKSLTPALLAYAMAMLAYVGEWSSWPSSKVRRSVEGLAHDLVITEARARQIENALGRLGVIRREWSRGAPLRVVRFVDPSEVQQEDELPETADPTESANAELAVAGCESIALEGKRMSDVEPLPMGSTAPEEGTCVFLPPNVRFPSAERAFSYGPSRRGKSGETAPQESGGYARPQTPAVGLRPTIDVPPSVHVSKNIDDVQRSDVRVRGLAPGAPASEVRPLAAVSAPVSTTAHDAVASPDPTPTVTEYQRETHSPRVSRKVQAQSDLFAAFSARPTPAAPKPLDDLERIVNTWSPDATREVRRLAEAMGRTPRAVVETVVGRGVDRPLRLAIDRPGALTPAVVRALLTYNELEPQDRGRIVNAVHVRALRAGRPRADDEEVLAQVVEHVRRARAIDRSVTA